MTTRRSPAAIELGMGLPALGRNGSGRPDIGAAARHAEALGFDAVWVPDLIVGDGTPGLDAMVAATVAAAATDKVRVGFGVLALPLRPVLWLAAQLQSLQHISGGRVLLGVGAGGVPTSPFWRAIGVPEGQRGPRTDAALAVLPQLIGGEPTRFDGQPDQPMVTLAPAAPVPPILVGGNSEAAIRRAAVYGDGWLPSQIGPETLGAGVARLRQLAADQHRAVPTVQVAGLTIATDAESLDAARAARKSFVRSLPGGHSISVDDATSTVTGSPDEAAERISAYTAVGADSIIFSPAVGSSGDAWRRQCDLAAEARSLLPE